MEIFNLINIAIFALIIFLVGAIILVIKGYYQNLLNSQIRNVEALVQQRTQALKEEQARLQASINSLSIGFIMIGRDYQIITINGTAKRMFSLQTVTLEELERLLAPTLNLRQLLEKCLNQSLIDIKEINLGTKYYRIFVNPIVINHPPVETIGSVILIEDITENKIIERSKDEFFSIASHELRTPLTAIKGFAFLIKRYYSQELRDPRLLSMIDRIEESSIRLISMVNDFLDTSRIEQSRIVLKPEKLILPNLIDSLVAEYQDTATAKGLTFVYHRDAGELPPVFGDPNRIKQVLINLIANAIKFTDKGGVEISATAAADPQFVKITVTDTGRGISPTNQSLLFRKFQQAGSNLYARDATGTGLGLYISKLLVERMNGQIRLERSSVDAGSSFSFTLPVAK